MINFGIIILFLLTHWVADFVLQTDWQAKNKSTRWDALVGHVLTYSSIWFPIIMILFNYDLGKSLAFCGITYLCHGATDYYTSRLNSYLWKKGDSHNFFVSVGFDQVLHYIQLFGLYLLLK